MIKASLTRQYSVAHAPGDILALPNSVAIILSLHHRYLYVLRDGQVHVVPLADPNTPTVSSSVENHTFHQGALFPYHHGFGAVYADTIYLWETIEHLKPSVTMRMERPILPAYKTAAPWKTRKGDTIWIEQPRHPHWVAPLAANALADYAEAEIVALLNDTGALNQGRYLARLRLQKGTAVWEGSPHDLSYDDFAAVARPLYDYPRDERLYPEIIDVLALSTTTIRVHSVGKPKRYAVYGMDFSVLADVDDDWTSTPIATVGRGFGTFSTDRRWLLLRSLRGKPRVEFYTIDGRPQGTLDLLNGNIMGHVQDRFLRMDLWEDTLWLTDSSGAVACCAIML